MNRSYPSGYILWAFIAIAVLSAALLTWLSVSGLSNDFLRVQGRLQQEEISSPVDLSGKVLSTDGRPLGGATVAIQDRESAVSADGSFFFRGINRTNSLMRVQAPGFRTEFIPVHLFVPWNVSMVGMDPVLLGSTDLAQVRLLFGGDTHFGRRYIDPFETTPPDRFPSDDNSAPIRVSDPDAGTRRILQHFRPLFQEADFTSLNLESAVVYNLSTPNREKEYILFTLPGSLAAMKWLGVQYVTLGNNHVNDYQEQGVSDTLESLSHYGIASSGAGLDAEEAFQAYRVVLNGTPYAFLSMNSIDGSEHTIRYVAADGKSGSANLRDTLQVNASIQRELDAGFFPVVQIHGGNEYTYEPADYIRNRMDVVTRAGAGLVVSHHPHIAQGVEVMNGVVVIEGLGNYVFDTERLETQLGLLASVDMNGRNISAVTLIPVYLADGTPRPITGRPADIFLRRIGEVSHNSTFPVYPYNGRGMVTLGSNETRAEDRAVQVNLTIPESGMTVLDLRQLEQGGESLSEAKDESGQSLAQMGRDLMIFGDFEDWDLDGQTGETDHWDYSEDSAALCTGGAFRGTASLCSIRYGRNIDDSVIAFRNRIRVTGNALGETPDKNLSFIAYMKGEDAGRISIISKYMASEGNISFGEEEILDHPGGTFPWQPFVEDIHMPADDPLRLRDPATDPRALQIFIHHSSPDTNRAIAQFDEIAVVSWEETVSLSDGVVLSTPHSRDFLRISGTPGTHRLNLKFRSFRPAVTA